MNKENNEEYLDDLLNIATNRSEIEEKNEINTNKNKVTDEYSLEDLDINYDNNLFDEMNKEDELFNNLDEEFNDGNVEGFLSEFESELEKENSTKVSEIEATLDIDMLNNLDNIVTEVSEKNQSNEKEKKFHEEDYYENTGSNDYDENTADFTVLEEDTNVNEGFKAEALFGTNAENEEELENRVEDKDIIELLDENIDDEDLADISELLKKEENNEFVEVLEEINPINLNVNNNIDDDMENSENTKKRKDEKKKTEIISSFLSVFNVFRKKEKKEISSETETENETKQYDENLEILKELEEEEGANKTSKKKKEKKPKKIKVKKAKKEKKSKVKQNVVDVSDPLPKVPVILFLALGLSIVILTMTATKLAGYVTYSKQAKEYFNDGKYRLAYERLQGIKLQKEEEELLEKVRILSSLEKEKVFFDNLNELHMYADALDSLAKGIERYRKGYSKAESLGVLKQFQKIGDSIESALEKNFNITADQAMELRKIEDKIVYTKKINEIVKKQGLAIEKE
ncbi:hypothetical protein [Anaerosacchariphilus polymeriproducens]|uniref:Uncharacterized protein n=1 Tax=Anaerosacchariphilus polymeriproducens TaxID=1812858 RepID=A0A371B0B3_9FIRM|nr:hypothetical protein [Anaerosacchariphilus polymeriproducens]RDU25170.1 hypothetical protein DWV06_00645 [Anaerosacchariphilus polymeriproducens]